ncbi:MAG: aldehyde ferredoxin oxidoreductase, partial [Candidatus Aenigmarchaeota archaeon]|nr:aldehyde ferredoxin oxidoreductase [Candidatus Aenigmarchaeota archaeon]
MIKGSYAGKILRVDLTSGKHKIEDLDFDFARTYIGGRGFGSKILYEELSPGIDPLSPNNILVFTPGALLGTATPAASRATLTFKSPLSGLHGDSASMSYCGLNLKHAGYDSLIIGGASSDPVYLFIDKDKIELKDASHIWGSYTVDTHKRIQTELEDGDISTICIGPAGENKVRYAAVMSDGQIGTHARCGGGAVFGSKNLKAIATRGNEDIRLVDKDSFQSAFKEYLKIIKLDPYVAPATKYGTPRFILHRAKYGIHGAENWRFGEYKWKTLHPDVFRNEYSVKAGSCHNCPVMCRREFMIPHGEYAGIVAKMEWESIARGITCGIVDPEVIIYGAHLHNLLGIDCESIGDTIAFAFECYEKGLLTDEDTDGLKFNFGNAETMFEATRRIAYREGIGDLLAEGTKRAAEKIGKGAQRFAMQVKGVEMSAGDPRGMPVRAVSYATGTRGADHLRSNPYIEEFVTPKEAKKLFGSEEASDLRKGVKGKGRLLKWSE